MPKLTIYGALVRWLPMKSFYPCPQLLYANRLIFLLAKGLSDAMLASDEAAKEAFQSSHDALSDVGACLRSLPAEAGSSNNGSLYTLLEVLVDKVRFMRPGRVLAVPTGWRTDPCGNLHPILMALQRQAGAGAFTLYVVNAGPDGLEYHPTKPDPLSARMLYSTSIRCADIPASRLEDAAFWYMAFKLLLDKSYGEGGKVVLYERL